MYNNLLTLKRIKGLTEDVKSRIEKSWTWGLITDEEFKSLMEMDMGELGDHMIEKEVVS